MRAVVKPSDRMKKSRIAVLPLFYLFIYFFEVHILHISHLHRCSLSIFCLPQFTQSVCDSQPLPWLNPHHGINRIDHLRHSERLPTQIMISSTVPLVQSTSAQFKCSKQFVTSMSPPAQRHITYHPIQTLSVCLICAEAHTALSRHLRKTKLFLPDYTTLFQCGRCSHLFSRTHAFIGLMFGTKAENMYNALLNQTGMQA